MTNPTPGEIERERGSGAPGGLFLLGALLVAGFLLFGAFAKSYAEILKTEPKPGEAIRVYTHAGVETLLAVLILARHRLALTWACVALLFAGFAGATMHRLLGGYPTCGCFGQFHVAPPVTLTIDAGIVMIGVGLARLAGLGGHGAGWIGALAIPMAISGSLVSRAISEPPPSKFDPKALIEMAKPQAGGAPAGTEKASTLSQSGSAGSNGATTPAQPAGSMQDVSDGVMSPSLGLLFVPRAAEKAFGDGAMPEWATLLKQAVEDADPSRAYLVFVYDPDCEVCQQFMPAMTQHQRFDSREANAKLRVVMVKKSDLEALGIPDWAWHASPTDVLIRQGKIIHEWGGHETPYPKVLQGEIEKGAGAYLDELARTYKPLAR